MDGVRSSGETMAIAQQVVVTVDPTTLAALKDLGYALYALKGFETTTAQGKALVWAETTTYADNTAFISTAEYQAYVTTVQTAGSVVITQSAVVDVALGDIATFSPSTGLTVAPGGNPDGVTIVNTTTTAYTAGLNARSTDAADGFSPFAAVPLHGLGEGVIAPVGKVLVTFSTVGVDVGSPLSHSVTQSLLIDLTDQTQLEASFDINTGWSFGNAAWGQTVPAGANLFAILAKQAPLFLKEA